jgi:hypothetical protein
MSTTRHALNPVKFAAVAGAVLIALAAPVLSAAVSIGGGASLPPALATVQDHTWND